MAVARDHLGRDRLRLEPEPLARDPLDLGIELGVRADRAGQLANAVELERGGEAAARSIELERPAGELPSEGDRLRVDSVRTPDLERRSVLLGALDDRCEDAVEPVQDERAAGRDLERQPG